ncbi:hypothetical protein FACS1894142_2710 [Spirochaetia bacterium]|nr:hypothetical protein FACS1894142_2710 [Spirochaetia bacterium]
MYLFPDWRIFDFSIIQIELLSEVYERFLSETDPEKKLYTGTFYTPPTLVEFILNEKIPIDKKNRKFDMKILDPACGSGIFLVESFKRIIKRYENDFGNKLTDFETLQDLLLKNIFGIDTNPQAIKIAAFSLYLALLENLDPKTLWQNKRLPYLINDPDIPKEKLGNNLYVRNSIHINDEIEARTYDLVIGNPPFGEGKLSSSINKYCTKNDFAQEQVLPFLHKAVSFSPNGDIALIFNFKILTNNGPKYQNFRTWLFTSCYVEKIYNFSILRKASKNFGGQLFNASVSPIGILFYRKDSPKNKSDRIMYYAPKTFIKTNILDGIVIDSTDVKYLPREECQKSDTKIWKVAMWGSDEDICLINKLMPKSNNSINDFITHNSIKFGVGFQLLTRDEKKKPQSEFLTNLNYLDADNITRYYVSDNILKDIKESIKSPKAVSFYKNFYNVDDISQINKLTDFRRLGDLDAYISPHIVVKKGLENNQVCASYIDVDCAFRDGVYGFCAENGNILKALMAYLNSKLSTYFLFMTISSYGIEREQIMEEEYLSIPIILKEDEIKNISDLVSEHIEKLRKNSLLMETEFPKKIKDKIDNVIFKSLSLNARDIIILNDTLENALDLFHNKERSKALFPVADINPYIKMICHDLNDFLEDQDLFVHTTRYTNLDNNTPLQMLKLSFGETESESIVSHETIQNELSKIDKKLWKQEATNIYFRKKLNYYDGDDIYIIRPNQKRFWTQTAAMEDASDLILEILNKE